ncbi:MAG: Nucleoside 5-triphosphatase RdgB (dHAPTP, dITP, XTP-specific) (EC 3.6.1.66) [Olavius algarvensis Delta 4 endosymbiont]|nr:MAG: Nucleoside 5-triphosphatase RdgB (dHAPTP, dITP, XTP-specific) (EC 3.6.1.66) [Olavius algarvensis Delta 4 endosymbiont]
MNNSVTLVIATRNQGKLKEISDLLKDYPVAIKSLEDFGPIPEVVEDGDTFEANAYKKASFTARVLGFPALADDSGLVVEALDGAPGVHSARWAGENATDQDKCRKLLSALEGRQDRRAAFECVISIAVPGGPALTYEGRCEGEITNTPSGENGFGYDPVFYYAPFEKTFAEIPREQKSQVSHRGKALMEVQAEFAQVLTWIERHMPVPERFACHGSDDDC